MSDAKPRYHRDNWPIAAAMIQYPNILPDGRSVQDQAPEDWAATLADVADAGFTELDPTPGSGSPTSPRPVSTPSWAS